MSTAAANSEADILARIIAPNEASLSADAAQSILGMKLTRQDTVRMEPLSAKASEGNLTPAECVEIDNYERVGCLLGILHSKARLSLKNATSVE